MTVDASHLLIRSPVLKLGGNDWETNLGTRLLLSPLGKLEIVVGI